MLEASTLARAYALSQRPASAPSHAPLRPRTSTFRSLRVQWRRLRRVLMKPGRPVAAEAISRVS